MQFFFKLQIDNKKAYIINKKFNYPKHIRLTLESLLNIE